jgi:hypothetical protein
MSIYLNSPKCSDEKYLKKKGKLLKKSPIWDEIPEEQFPVCLIDKENFKTASIAYDKNEFERLKLLNNGRRKMWYLLSKKDIVAVFKPTGKGIIRTILDKQPAAA